MRTCVLVLTNPLSQDWPTDNEFKSKFPDLFEDFSQSLPAPDFTRRNGALNISSFVCFDTDQPLQDGPDRHYSSPRWTADRTSGPRCTMLS